MTLDKESTGLKSLDTILQNLRRGDNVVWQVDKLENYLHFVRPYVARARADGKKIIYIRFASHPPVVGPDKNIKTYELDAGAGFESFSKQVHEIIAKEGVGAFYVFDCLSDLLSSWATDLMVGNYFMVTCPYLFKLDTVAYFAILRDSHSFRTIARIRETTQLLIDVYDLEGRLCIQPLKVWNRYSPTMFLPHLEQEGDFVPLTSSVDAARIFSYLSTRGEKTAERNLDHWDRLFLKAEEMEISPSLDQLTRIMVGREARMLSLVKEKFTLTDLLEIKSKMIGSGFIGGKALGMLLARKILLLDKTYDWRQELETHDSFYIGSDVFYTYIVENGWWELWLEQKSEEGYFSRAQELREKMLKGKFPEEIKDKFIQLIEYFGQSPIIVRSSSLLEDSFGNAFAGKYESFFITNQGDPEERYARFEDTVRRVFASTMNEDALSYRLQRGLSQLDEQMALLVQRVSGTQRKYYFFPFIAGVGVSFNTFVWHKDMDPKAGMLRMVFGLGTRAVNRVEGDYPRIAALDAPLLRPYAGMANLKRFSQHDVDVLNIAANELQTVPLEKILREEPEIEIKLVAERDAEAENKLKEIGAAAEAWVLTFDKFLANTDFVSKMQRMLKTLEASYQYPVDVEFTVNFGTDGEAKINLLQCRPLQAKGSSARVKIPARISRESVVFESEGNLMGGSVAQNIRRVIMVDPQAYGDLLMNKKYEVARLIGRLNRDIGGRDKMPTMLIGPGRWGTRDPSLGVPVNFAEINHICALIEVDDPNGGFMPELSFGSHFFLDLVETDIFYAALFMQEEKVFFNKSWLDSLPNGLIGIMPDAADLQKVVKVFDFTGKELKLLSDVTSQKVVCIK